MQKINKVTVNEAAAILEVTAATIKNWQKTGRLSEEISMEEIRALKGSLHSRRNKTQLVHSQTYFRYIDSRDLKNLLTASPEERELPLVLAEAALRLFSPGVNRLKDFLCGELSIGEGDRLIRDLLGDYEHCDINPILGESWSVDPEDDVLGFIYMSLLPLNRRRKFGAYYTPQALSAAAVRRVGLKGIVLDPCCGSGSFLIAAARELGSPLSLRAIDIDPVAVALTRINLYLRYPQLGTDYLYKNITVKSFFDDWDKYDTIIGNPPWGGRPEMSGQFLLHALELLKDGGRLSFILPEALLTTKVHAPLRMALLSETRLTSADYLSSGFYGVYCPSVILVAEKGPVTGISGCRVNSDFTVGQRKIDPRCLNLRVTNREYATLRKMRRIKNAVYLKGSVFALGIVTGDNRRLITGSDGRPIIRGTDVSPFHIKEPDSFLAADLSNCQQSAPLKIYEAEEKIVYRFIGRRPVFAVDRRGRLTLNSCNVIIPKIDGLSIDYITAVLNSSAVGFFLEKSFAAAKWLRWQLEEIPIPHISLERQLDICQSSNWDEEISALYNLSLEDFLQS